jgi:hypothetical protein
VLAASAVTRLFLRHFLEVLELDLRSYPPFLLRNCLFELVGKLLLQRRELLLVVLLRLLKQLRESALLRLLLANRLAQLACLTLHLVFVRALLDIRVIALLVLSRFVVHLLQPVALGVRVRSGPRRPVDIVDFCERSLCIFDRPDDFAVLVSGAAEADGHALAIKPGQDTGEDSVDGAESGESDAGSLLVG